MKGHYIIEIYTKKINYKLKIKRNITILRGDSCRGKTTLIDLVESWTSGQKFVTINTTCNLAVLTDGNWKSLIETNNKTIFFIDESENFLVSHEFARYINEGCDNYFVIISRIDFKSLNYSINEVYELVTNNKLVTMKPYYRKYKSKLYEDLYNPLINLNEVIVEDSKSGFDFFIKFFKELYNINEIRSSNGKSNILKEVTKNGNKKLIIADGAAIGNEMENLLYNEEFNFNDKITLYLPESFEWLLFNLEEYKDCWNILSNPELFVDSYEYSSYERFFFELIKKVSENTEYRYSKNNINNYYIENKILYKIDKIMPKFSINSHVEDTLEVSWIE